MNLTVYHLKTCDTCRKAIKSLEGADHEVTLIDVRADGVPSEKLRALAEAVGYDALLNTRSTTWRNLPDEEKTSLDEVGKLALLQTHPTLIKRPVIERGEHVTVGWSPAIQAEFL